VSEKIDLSFQVVQTKFAVVYASLPRLEADVLVSSDDVHFSRTGGVAVAIRESAGDAIQNDLRKHTLPVPIGAVLVTTGGQLGAKYIFHAATTEFNARPRAEIVMPIILRRILDLAGALQVKSLAIPLLMGNRSELPKAQLLEILLRSAACYLVTQPTSLLSITVTLYKGNTSDHAAAEKELLREIEPVCDLTASWREQAKLLNARLSLLQPLYASITDDGDFKKQLEERIATEERALCRVFDCPNTSDLDIEIPSERHDELPRSREEYERDKTQLSSLLDELDIETKHLKKLRATSTNRLRKLEQRHAELGINTPIEVVNEIEDITEELKKLEEQLQKAETQLVLAQRDLDTLQRRWQRQTAN